MATTSHKSKGKTAVGQYVKAPKTAGTAKQRASKARDAMTGLKAGVPVTKTMYRPNR